MNYRLAITVILVGLIPSLAFPQGMGPSRWSVSFGAFLTDQDMETEFQSNLSDAGFDLDLENDLGLDSSTTVFRFDGFFRIADRHRLDASIFDLSRSADATVSTEFEWQDTVFPIDFELNTDLNLAIYKLAYSYEFFQRENGYIAATGGLFIADVSLELSVPATGAAEIGEVTAPLPVFGLRGGYDFADRWSLHLSSELFFISVDEVEGLLYDLYGGVDYRLFDNAAIGVGYNFVDLDVDATDENLGADLNWRYSGVVAYLKFLF